MQPNNLAFWGEDTCMLVFMSPTLLHTDGFELAIESGYMFLIHFCGLLPGIPV